MPRLARHLHHTVSLDGEPETGTKGMKIPDQPLTLQKEQAAIRQAEAAIAALQHGHFDIAVTLAGAAEGIYSDRKGSDIHTQMMK